MLGETKELVKTLVEKVQLLEFTLSAMNTNHKDYAAKIDTLYKRASNHKLKLIEEILRLSNAGEVEEVKPAEPVTLA